MPTGIYPKEKRKGMFEKGHRFYGGKTGIYQHKKGEYHTEKSKQKMREKRKGKKPTLGKHWKVKDTSKMKGHRSVYQHKSNQGFQKNEKHWNWKGGITSENHKVRNSIEMRLWREAVFARDNWTCQKTGIKGGKIKAHHINNFADFLEIRTSISNGITLSEKAHIEFHKIYGRKNNTKGQLEEFLNIKYDKSI